jgi:DNA-directed RNA polymerase II subunit RPB2
MMLNKNNQEQYHKENNQEKSIMNSEIEEIKLRKNNIPINDPSYKYIEAPWSIIESYFQGKYLERLVRHQIESYNDFVNYQIKKTINMFNPVNIYSVKDYDEQIKKHGLEMIITFDNFHIYKPQTYENNGASKVMFPQDARQRSFTYASPMTVDINIKIIRRTGEDLKETQINHKKLSNIHIGKLPIMVKSSICVLNQYSHLNNRINGECEYDAGGYFIINGSEKTVLAQERAAENKVCCFNTSKTTSKWMWTAEIKSVPDFKIISPKQINMYIAQKNNGFGHPIYLDLPKLKTPIPLFVVFRALGVTSDKDIVSYIVLNVDEKKQEDIIMYLRGSIIDASKYNDQESALQYIMNQANYTPINVSEEEGHKKKKEYTLDILDGNLFPHCKTSIHRSYIF